MAAVIALVASPSQVSVLIELLQKYQGVLYRYPLVATAKLAAAIVERTSLKVEAKLDSDQGGLSQIAAMVAEKKIAAVLSFEDAEALLQPHFQSLHQLCITHDVPLALNLATAIAILEEFRRARVAHLIFNPVSGQGDAKEELKTIESILGSAMVLQVCETTPEIHPAMLVQDAIAADADLVIASGGDGTVSAVAGALVGTDIPLGIIPRGTANAFAVAMGIGGVIMQIRTACEIIAKGHVAPVDVARCNGLPMVLLAGIGLEAEVVERANREAKNRWGVLAYIMEGLKQFNQQELFETKIEVEGVVQTFQAGAVTIANAAPPTSVMAQGLGSVNASDGLLDVTIAAPKNELEAIGAMVNLVGAALLRSPTTRDDIINLQTRSIKVSTTTPQKVVLDGEMIGTTPIDVDCIPHGLNVIVPDATIKMLGAEDVA